MKWSWGLLLYFNTLFPFNCFQVKDLHYEVELGVVIGTGGKDIAVADAEKHIAGII